LSPDKRAWFVVLLALFLAAPFAGAADALLPPIVTHNNHQHAGALRHGELALNLTIARGEWHPEADDGDALAVYAFGEVGKPLQNPGPLIRVRQGTKVRVNLHNTLAVPIAVHGLADGDAVIRLAAGASAETRFNASTPGLFLYWGATEAEQLKLRYGIDAELSGAIVVDPPGKVSKDEVFIIEMMSEHAGIFARQTLATINGKSWPYTQRFTYAVGKPVRWRWINAANEPHAMHMHGFYYHVDASSYDGKTQQFEGEARPLVVTQRVIQGESFDMTWAPDRAGQWLFHCHMFVHMTKPTVPNVPGLTIRRGVQHAGSHANHGSAGMGQLVLGITVPEDAKHPAAAKVWHAERKLQLEISGRGGAPRYALAVRDNGQPAAIEKPGLIGPPIVLTRGQPTEIEVVNKLAEPTAIHWHGIEIESFYDGVPGWGGTPKQMTPPIAPGTSFVARMTPPRAGTFIYHTHWHDQLQLINGVYGPLIVLPPGEKFDPAHDLVFLLSIGDFGALGEIALINGTPQNKTLQLKSGQKYRFRLINISTNNQAMQVSFRDAAGAPAQWTLIAKDGADLPASQARASPAKLTVTVGETYDVEFQSDKAQDLLFDLLQPAQKIHVVQTLVFAP